MQFSEFLLRNKHRMTRKYVFKDIYISLERRKITIFRYHSSWMNHCRHYNSFIFQNCYAFPFVVDFIWKNLIFKFYGKNHFTWKIKACFVFFLLFLKFNMRVGIRLMDQLNILEIEWLFSVIDHAFWSSFPKWIHVSSFMYHKTIHMVLWINIL